MLEHDYEPVPGMPQALPDDEKVIWQGPAQFKRLAYSTFHVRKLGVYFLGLIAINLTLGLSGGVAVAESLASAATFGVLAVFALALLTLYARFVARATIYTLTDRRIVIRTGVAVPVTVNLPFTLIERAALRLHADGSGEIALIPDASSRASYVLLWPFVKPFRFLRVQPVIRGIEDAGRVASLLAEQLSLAASAPEGVAPAPAPAPEAQEKGSFWSYPRLPLAAASSLVVVSLIAVAWGQLAANGNDATVAGPTAIAEVGLYFDDREDGSVEVIDADSGRTLDVLAPGSNGFLRSAMRTFVNARRASDIGRDEPFMLARMPNGQLILSDPATAREIDLRAFGRTNADAFGRFLSLAEDQAAAATDGTVSNDAQPAPTAVALSNQEVNP